MATKNSKQKAVRAQRVQKNPLARWANGLYRHSAPLLICESLLFLGGALLILFNPVAMLTALTFVIGIGLIMFGMYRAISGFIVSHNIGGGWLDVIFGLINIVLGIIFCVYPVGSIIGIVYIFVVLFMFKAFRALVFAINMARARFGHYVMDLILAILLVALAIALVFFPMAGAIALVYYLALTLLLYSASDIYMFIELRRLKKQVE